MADRRLIHDPGLERRGELKRRRAVHEHARIAGEVQTVESAREVAEPQVRLVWVVPGEHATLGVIDERERSIVDGIADDVEAGTVQGRARQLAEVIEPRTINAG